ncbi:MAG: hypothetical protein Q7O66_22380 [Dehalococcoidia bacterium]|nr:hypothetical protein [Dehalococcoidia bacterium]
MGGLTRELRSLLLVTEFLAMVYLAYLCTYLAPTARLRRWGATTSWLLSLPGNGLSAGDVHSSRARGTNTLE